MKLSKADRLLNRCEIFLSAFVDDNFIWDDAHTERTCLGCNATLDQPHRSGCVVAGAMELAAVVGVHLWEKATGTQCGTFDPRVADLIAAFATEADAATK